MVYYLNSMNSGENARLCSFGSLHKISEKLKLLLSWIKLILDAITFKSGSKMKNTNFYWKKRKSSSGNLQHTMLSFEWQLYHLDYISKILHCEHVRCLTVGMTGCMHIWTVVLPSILFSISMSATLYYIHCSLLYINSSIHSVEWHLLS